MNRGLQIPVRKRLARLASEKPLAGVGGLELQFGQMQFERAEMTGTQRGLQQAFALGEILEDRAGLVLAAAPPDRGADDADQRGRMERAFDEGDVAEHLSEPHGVGIALGAAALMRQQHDRKIRPGRLIGQPAHQAAQIRGLDRLIGDHRKTGAALDLMHQACEIGADIGIVARFPDQRRGHRGVASRRSQDDGTLGRCARSHALCSCSNGRPSPT